MAREQSGETFELCWRPERDDVTRCGSRGLRSGVRGSPCGLYLVYFNVVRTDAPKNWRVVWVVIPWSGDDHPRLEPVGMGALAGAMIGLFEGSMLLVRVC